MPFLMTYSKALSTVPSISAPSHPSFPSWPPTQSMRFCTLSATSSWVTLKCCPSRASVALKAQLAEHWPCVGWGGGVDFLYIPGRFTSQLHTQWKSKYESHGNHNNHMTVTSLTSFLTAGTNPLVLQSTVGGRTVRRGELKVSWGFLFRCIW